MNRERIAELAISLVIPRFGTEGDSRYFCERLVRSVRINNMAGVTNYIAENRGQCLAILSDVTNRNIALLIKVNFDKLVRESTFGSTSNKNVDE